MEKLLFIYMDGCPYCHMAADVLATLTSEHPEYGRIPVEKVNETTEPEKLKGRNYYYVPTFFYGDEKIYEAQPGDGKNPGCVFCKTCIRKKQPLRCGCFFLSYIIGSPITKQSPVFSTPSSPLAPTPLR